MDFPAVAHVSANELGEKFALMDDYEHRAFLEGLLSGVDRYPSDMSWPAQCIQIAARLTPYKASLMLSLIEPLADGLRMRAEGAAKAAEVGR